MAKDLARWRRIPLLVLGSVGLGALSFLYVFFGTWVWELPISPRQGALRVLVPRDVLQLDLDLGRPTDVLRLYLGESATTVRDFWTHRRPDRVSTGELRPCAVADDAAPGKGGFACSIHETTLSLKLAPAAELAAEAPGSYQRELFLVAVEEQQEETLPIHVIPAALLLRSVKVTAETGIPFAVHASECSASPRLPAPRCHLVDQMLGRPRVVNRHDPQPVVVGLTQLTTSYVVPALISSMLLADALLGFGIMILLWWRPTPRLRIAGGAGPRVLVAPVEAATASLRRALEWLEVTGPALGFLLTVGSLLLAFDPAIFSERDTGRFTEAISLAMTATFAGLLMRILAFSADRLLEHRERVADAQRGKEAS